ncbi:MAG: DHH family phosphoesterase, partial [Ardenticatenaceae bacterium]
MREAPLDLILYYIQRARRILVFSHVGADGDAYGSALGLMWLLREEGKEIEVSFEEPLLPIFSFLPGAGQIADRAVTDHDLIIAVDGSDEGRYGANFSSLYASVRRPVIIGIDHHKTNTRFADVNWVDSDYAATAQMIHVLARHAGWPVAADAATCLATGCVTDTNAFSTDHTTPELLETVADLMRAGAPLSRIIRHSMNTRSQTDGRLWGHILSTIEIEDHVAWATSRAVDRRAVGAQESDGSGIATFLRNLIGIG